MQEQAQSSIQIKLPLSVIDKVDIARLLREVDALNNFLESAAVREPNAQPKLPKTSQLLDEILLQNKLDALNKKDRHRLIKFLEETRSKAPIIHISFSADPSPLFSQKLVAWLRDQIHPLVLLQIGLQPTIGAGCIVRTDNKQFDFSLRQKFIDQRNVLIKRLRESTVHTTPANLPAAPSPSAVTAQPVPVPSHQNQDPPGPPPSTPGSLSSQLVVPLGRVERPTEKNS